MSWEEAYLKTLIAALRPSGNVLEVGFGLSSSLIQDFCPKHHTLITCDPSAADWAKGRANVSIMCDSWQNSLPSLGFFDAIFFRAETEIAESRETGTLVLRQGQKLLADITAQFPQLATLQYSNADLDIFCTQIEQSELRQLPHFLYKLKQNAQISDVQYEQTLQKYSLERKEEGHQFKVQPDQTFLFLKECLQNHMRKGGRFSCFCANPTSKYENPSFFEHIITNPDFEYQETAIHYQHQEALLFTIEKHV